MQTFWKWTDIDVKGCRFVSDWKAMTSQPADLRTLPSPPPLVKLKNIKDEDLIFEDITEYLLQQLPKWVTEGAFLWQMSMDLTNGKWVNKYMRNISSCTLLQKNRRSVWTNKRMEFWKVLTCTIRRQDFNSKVLPYLRRVDGKNDYGLIEPIRLIGNNYDNTVPYIGEHRAYAHRKYSGLSLPDEKGFLQPVLVARGSKNLTEGGDHSAEEVSITTDTRIATAFFKHWEAAYIFSEGLAEVGHHIRAMYHHTSRKLSNARPPKCPQCKVHLAKNAISPMYTGPGNVILRCVECGTVYSFKDFGEL